MACFSNIILENVFNGLNTKNITLSDTYHITLSHRQHFSVRFLSKLLSETVCVRSRLSIDKAHRVERHNTKLLYLALYAPCRYNSFIVSGWTSTDSLPASEPSTSCMRQVDLCAYTYTRVVQCHQYGLQAETMRAVERYNVQQTNNPSQRTCIYMVIKATQWNQQETPYSLNSTWEEFTNICML